MRLTLPSFPVSPSLLFLQEVIFREEWQTVVFPYVYVWTGLCLCVCVCGCFHFVLLLFGLQYTLMENYKPLKDPLK